MSERYASDVPTWVPGVDGVISTRAWPEITQYVESLRRTADGGRQTTDEASSVLISQSPVLSPASIA